MLQIPALERLVHELSKLPSIGPKSAQRLAYYLLRAPTEYSEKLNQALKVAEKALRYMTEDYDCDPADVADFDKRRADQALEEIKKIMGEG